MTRPGIETRSPGPLAKTLLCLWIIRIRWEHLNHLTEPTNDYYKQIKRMLFKILQGNDDNNETFTNNPFCILVWWYINLLMPKSPL